MPVALSIGPAPCQRGAVRTPSATGLATACRIAGALLVACTLSAGCGSSEPTTEVRTTAPPDVAAPPADAVVTPSGLATRVITPGTGTVHPGKTDRVTVHYSGWTTDGRLFDSSVTRGEPTTFRLDQVIPGWSEGLQLMVTGETRRMWIPEDLAYRGRQPPRGMLVFDVELLSIP